MPSTPFTSIVCLEDEIGPNQIPSCARVAEDRCGKLREVYDAMHEARRVIVLCGAGISVYAGIPDFRSSSGLFQSLKREHPKENISSGRDLFDSAVFKSEERTALFYKMISHLATLSDAAQPTPFHSMLRELDKRGQLARVYTQNIDALEERAGLSFGVPTFPARTRKRKASNCAESPSTSPSSRSPTPRPLSAKTTQLPRCIPLHGTLQDLYCPSCHFSLPLRTPEHLEALRAGTAIHCPQCAEFDSTRRLVGKRTRGPSRLRPSIVLYNEPHRQSERVGECVKRDLLVRKDLLIVAGTSLRIPGAKRIVREFAKALHVQAGLKTVYVNLDFPVAAREWDGVFDVWVRGDVQSFARGFGGTSPVHPSMRRKRGLEDRSDREVSPPWVVRESLTIRIKRPRTIGVIVPEIAS